MKTPTFITALIICITIFSCKKTTNGPTTTITTNKTTGPYLAASTGWQRVAIIKSTTKNSIRAYDLQIDGSTARVLYSEGFLANGADIQTYFKAQSAIGSTADATISTVPVIFSLFIQNNEHLDYQYIWPQFRPGTFATENFCYYHYFSHSPYINLNDNNLNLITTNQVTSSAQSFKNLPNGDILGGEVANTASCIADYYSRTANTWTSYDANAHNGSVATTCTPFILADGSLLSFRLFYKTGKAYLAVAGFSNAAYPASGFADKVSEEHPEFAPNIPDVNSIFFNPTSVVAYTIDGNTITVVLLHRDILGQTATVSAYKWTEGASSIQTLYTGIAISNDLSTMLQLHRREIGCTTDGTLYAIIFTGGNSYHLSLTNAGGEKSYGTAGNNTGGNYVLTVNCLRYFNGAYYAVVAPTQGGTSADAQHMDVIKLMP
jgi:hypothetical protein